MAESAGRHPLLRYLLLQAPDVVLAGLVLVGLWNWMDVPTWAAVAAMVVWVGKDVAMYPLVRRSFTLGESEWVGVRRLLGARGVATVDLAPSGWVRVKGELWQAEALREEDSVPEGTWVRVLEVRGMTLVIERDSEPLKQSTRVVVEPADERRGAADQEPGGGEVRNRRDDAPTARRPLG